MLLWILNLLKFAAGFIELSDTCGKTFGAQRLLSIPMLLPLFGGSGIVECSTSSEKGFSELDRRVNGIAETGNSFCTWAEIGRLLA